MWNVRKYSRKSLVIIDESVMIDTLKVCFILCKYLKRLDGLHTRMSYFSCTVDATGGLIRRETIFQPKFDFKVLSGFLLWQTRLYELDCM